MTKTSDRPDKSGAFVDDISLSQGTCVGSDWFGGPEPPVITLPTQPGPTEPTKPVATEPPPGPGVEGYEMEVGDCLEYVHSSGHASVETCAKWCNPDPNCKSFTYKAEVTPVTLSRLFVLMYRNQMILCILTGKQVKDSFFLYLLRTTSSKAIHSYFRNYCSASIYITIITRWTAIVRVLLLSLLSSGLFRKEQANNYFLIY